MNEKSGETEATRIVLWMKFESGRTLDLTINTDMLSGLASSLESDTKGGAQAENVKICFDVRDMGYEINLNKEFVGFLSFDRIEKNR